MKVLLTCRGVKGNLAVVQTGQYAIYIAIQSRIGQIECKRGNSSCGIFSDTWKRNQLLEDARLI